MKIRVLFFSGLLLYVPTVVYGACSVANLTRCLDSVCAINIGANPAARCQYCGSSNAGEPTKSTGMKTISAGSSAKYTISDKELKDAPSDPGQRYIWGTKLCLEKVAGCTTDDVSDNYDSLIEQSCKAAGISAEMASLSKKTNKAKTQKVCTDEINACVIDIKRCTANYKNCESDESFDKYFSECSILSNGCESFLSEIRSSLTSERNTTIANAGKILQNIITAYQEARENRLKSAQSSCKGDVAKAACIARVCNNNMRNKCEVIIENGKNVNEYEQTVAGELCDFYKIACERLK
jgi:hypothetical protein